MNKHLFYTAAIAFIFLPLSAQVQITAQKETLYEIDLNNQNYEISYSYNDEEGLCGLLAPVLMDNGDLILYKTYCENNCYVYKNSTFTESDLIPDLVYYDFQGITGPVSQNGTIKIPGGIYFIKLKSKFYYEDLFYEYIGNHSDPSIVIDVPEGIVCYWYFGNKTMGLQVNDCSVNIIDTPELDDWLKGQGFSFDKSNSNIYKGNQIWFSPEADNQSGYYIGKTLNGFNIFYNNAAFYFTDNTGCRLCEMKENWSGCNLQEGTAVFDRVGIGPYGEIYLVISPVFSMKEKHDYYVYRVQEGSCPEIAVVRNHLKYFGVLTDNNVRLRAAASSSSKSLSLYSKDTGFFIIDKGNAEETIGGETGVWYHVHLLDGTEGYFFGAYVKELYDGPGTQLPWPNVN